MNTGDGVTIKLSVCILCLGFVGSSEALRQRSKSAERLGLVFLLCLLVGFVQVFEEIRL